MTTLTLPLPPRFSLPHAVCSYGFYALAPNRWNPPARALERPLRGRGDRLVQVRIVQPRGRQTLRIRCDRTLADDERSLIRAQVARMCHLDEPAEVFDRWYRLCPSARKAGFARIFRSPTLFEDMVKTMTCCNVTWPNTMRMNALLCQHYGHGAFPTPAELAAVSAEQLKRECKVGYRAERMVRLARDVHQGRIDLASFECSERPTAELARSLRSIHGIGPYAAHNLCQLLGRYDCLAFDSETYRHFRHRHRVPTPRSAAGLARLHRRIERHYARFAPFQFLAYWFELWGNPADRFQGHEWTTTPQRT